MALCLDNKVLNFFVATREGVHRLAGSIFSLIDRKIEIPVPDLIEALQDEESQVRWYAAWALTKMGLEAKAAVPALIEALQDEQGEVRQLAAKALSRMGAEFEIPASVLEEAVTDTEKDVRRFAQRALALVANEAITEVTL